MGSVGGPVGAPQLSTMCSIVSTGVDFFPSSTIVAIGQRLAGFDLCFEKLQACLLTEIDSQRPTKGNGSGGCQGRAEDQYQGRA